MDKKNGRKVCFLAAVFAFLVVAVAIPAEAGDSNVNCNKRDLNRLLTGDYFQNNSFACAAAYAGFDQGLNRNPDPSGLISGTYSGSTQGVTSYDGHGGITYRGQVLTIAHDPGGSTEPLKSPISQYDMECRGTYQVNQDLSIEAEYDCRIDPSAGPFLVNPPYPPEFYMEIEGVHLTGQLLGTAGNILALRSDTAPNVETIKGYKFYLPTPNGLGFYEGPIPLGQRICTSSGTAMKIVGKGTNLRERGK